MVAQLDPINAFLLLVQPVLRDPRRRELFISDMQRLAVALQQHFWRDGIFWGVSTRQGQYRSRHVDFGHTLKAYWMMLEVDKRLEGHPFQTWLETHIDPWLERAHDGQRWKKRPISATSDESGSDWWIYAESDQLAATRNLASGAFTTPLAESAGHWLEDYVDPEHGEVISGIRGSGAPAGNWSLSDTFKCNLWKNGYHSTEHALVMYLHGRHLEGQPADLHFAVSQNEADTFPARPYFFHGREVARTMGSTIAVGARTLQHVTVSFDELW